MRRGGLPPDLFVDLLRRRIGSQCEPDPIAWFIREAQLAIVEQRAARHVDRMRRIAHRHGASSYYQHRDAQARAAGHPSFWHYRKSRGWS
jgi:hypothetical protein